MERKKVLSLYSKKLRTQMTEEEKHLWYDFLKKLPVTVHRQKVLHKYIVDFYIATAKLVIELDGSQHYDDSSIEKDIERCVALSELLPKNANFADLCTGSGCIAISILNTLKSLRLAKQFIQLCKILIIL